MRFTGRICSSPRIRLQENALGTLGGTGGGPAPRAPGHPLTWGAGGLTCPQIAGARLPWRALSERRVRAPLLPSALDLGPGRLGRAWWLRPAGRAQGRVRRPSGSGEGPGLPQRPDAHARLRVPRGAFSASQHPSSQHCTPLSNCVM